MNQKVNKIQAEIAKVIVGKDDVIQNVLMSILAGGHILLEDIPGVGKTTLALAFSKTMGLHFKRMQFTPDVVPSDIVGFTMFDTEKKCFSYHPGAVMCHFFLADEINRTSSKTQAALLEVMQEGNVTVDGETHVLPQPFVVMATQNPLGTAGTQMLPEAQLDRFMVRLSMGYPDFEAQVHILKDREKQDPLEMIDEVVTVDEVLQMKEDVKNVYVDDKIYRYITAIVEETRKNEFVRLGVSPRGALALCNMAKAAAYVQGRNYVLPEDVESHVKEVCAHRLLMHPKAALANVNAESILDEILTNVQAPKFDRMVEELL